MVTLLFSYIYFFNNTYFFVSPKISHRKISQKYHKNITKIQKLTLDGALASIIEEDLHHVKLTFTEAADTNQHKNGRNFRRQHQYTEWLIDIIHRTPASNLTESVFKPMCKAH